MDYFKESVKFHKKLGSKLEVKSRVKLNSKKAMSLAYTPGVAQPCLEIFKNKSLVYDFTIKSNSVAVVTDGSAVLGLGNIGAEASIPVMEGKSILFKEFANIDAFPIALNTQDEQEIITTVKHIAPVFGGINLEDISAPRCFTIEQSLQDIGIPVFHDDQHGTAIVTLAALFNAVKVVKKNITDLKVVISGAGAAGVAITKMLLSEKVDEKTSKGVNQVILCDSKGPIYSGRKDLNSMKQEMTKITNPDNINTVEAAFKGADVFIGVSAPGIVSKQMVSSMANNSIVFAMSNPTPEIMPNLAKQAGAAIIATGRSDFPNQINNVLAFPGIFRGALDSRTPRINQDMMFAAARVLAKCVPFPKKTEIVPYALNKKVVPKVATAVKSCSKKYFG